MSFAAELWGRTPPLEDDSTPKSSEGDTTDLVIRQARIIHELRTELEALKKFTACTRSHPHEAMAQDCELRTEIARLTNELTRLRAAPAVPQGYEIHEIPADYSGLVWLEGQVRAVARLAQAATGPQGWTDADSDAARLALELECLLMDTKDLSVVSKWWASANEALELHRQRLDATPAPAPAVPQGEPVAWMVYGNYTRQPFGMLSSAEAYMRGLLKSDPDGGYHIRPLRYATPAPAPAPAPEAGSESKIVIDVGPGGGGSSHTQIMWDAWQARAALSAKGGGHGG